MSEQENKLRFIVVMGVSGSGKSTIAAKLADCLGWIYEDADSFHPRGNVEKMLAGQPLADEDRWPWLAAIAAWITDARVQHKHAVIACSALRRSYRRVLFTQSSDMRLVYLKGGADVIARRLALRKDHYMPSSLLDSQFATLEEPAPDEYPIIVSIEPAPQAITERIVSELAISTPAGVIAGESSKTAPSV